jgi:hypothetical protein
VAPEPVWTSKERKKIKKGREADRDDIERKREKRCRGISPTLRY